MRVIGLFSGIGGIELGLQAAGHHTELLCENDRMAKAVLKRRFPGVPIKDDIRSLKRLPRVDLVTAGFPCQDLSQAGATNGIRGPKSGIVNSLMDVIEATSPSYRPGRVLIENVPFMLNLNGGSAIKFLTKRLSDLGYMWAYRVVDTRAFGLPHRRRRVLLLASRTSDPRAVLLGQDVGAVTAPQSSRVACGFYWTEGNRGIGWAVDAIPPLKGSSGLGIPSPPGIWMPDGKVALPHIRDAERLQGFRAGWTAPISKEGGTLGARWRLVGNAVSVPVSSWLGRRLAHETDWTGTNGEVIANAGPWPNAAWGVGSKAYRVDVSDWPVSRQRRSLAPFLKNPVTPLSQKAASGFLARLRASSLRVDQRFLRDLAEHVKRMERHSAVSRTRR
jgi:DNA (cytosine-5)-methyltransferase 1